MSDSKHFHSNEPAPKSWLNVLLICCIFAVAAYITKNAMQAHSAKRRVASAQWGSSCTLAMAEAANPRLATSVSNSRRSAERSIDAVHAIYDRLHTTAASLPAFPTSTLPAPFKSPGYNFAYPEVAAAIDPVTNRCWLYLTGDQNDLTKDISYAADWRASLAYAGNGLKSYLGRSYRDNEKTRVERDENIYYVLQESIPGGDEVKRLIVKAALGILVKGDASAQSFGDTIVKNVHLLVPEMVRPKAYAMIADIYEALDMSAERFYERILAADAATKPNELSFYRKNPGNDLKGFVLRRCLEHGGIANCKAFQLRGKFWLTKLAAALEHPKAAAWAKGLQKRFAQTTAIDSADWYAEQLRLIAEPPTPDSE